GLLRSPTALPHVARDAGADDVLPGRSAPLAPRHDVVERQLARGELLAAELALVVVTREDVPPVDLHRLLGQPVVVDQADDWRHLDLAVHGSYPVVILLPEVARPVVTDLTPGLEVVGRESAVLHADDLGQVLGEQAEGPPDRD